VNDSDMQTFLVDLLLDSDDDVESVNTFDEAGVLTHNQGLVVAFDNGAEFQITIVQSAGWRDDDEDEDKE